MPFIGKDWRSTGETWVRVTHTAGWEQVKLRPIQLGSCRGSSSALICPETGEKLEFELASSLPNETKLDIGKITQPTPLHCVGSQASSSSLELAYEEVFSSQFEVASNLNKNTSGSLVTASPRDLSPDDSLDDEKDSSPTRKEKDATQAMPIKAEHQQSQEQEDLSGETRESHSEERWIPYCHVKTSRSKEFIGCTSMSEAFQRLDLARAVGDVRRFNYICKVVQILVHEKLKNISATARKHLFAIIHSIVLNSVEQDTHISVARDLLTNFSTGLEGGHVCGSPSLVNRQLGVASNLMDMLVQDKKPTTLADSNEESTTFLDLPREAISLILRRLPDHTSILEVAKAHETFEAVIERETRVWKGLCQFHFTQAQIDQHTQDEHVDWRHTFFELKKYHGLREVYADLIHMCCHCKAIFWKDHGHPCVGTDPPSVRVTPQQFVDMLIFL